jgi:hypothetical protein
MMMVWEGRQVHQDSFEVLVAMARDGHADFADDFPETARST